MGQGHNIGIQVQGSESREDGLVKDKDNLAEQYGQF